MQMMPKISCPQRVASEAMGRASAASDVVAISVPLAFYGYRGAGPAWHTIYSEWDGCLVRGQGLRRRAHGVSGGGAWRRLGEGKPRKNFVEIATAMCRQGHPKGTNPRARSRWLAGQARGKLSRARTSWTGAGAATIGCRHRLTGTGLEVGHRLGPLDQPIRPTHGSLGGRFHIAAADHALGCVADIGCPRGHHLVERPAMGTEEFSRRTRSPFLGHVVSPFGPKRAFSYYVLCIPDRQEKQGARPKKGRRCSNVRAAETAARKDAINRPPASAVRPLRLGYRQRRVGAVQELDRGEHQLGIADVLEIVHLELAVAVGLVPGLAGPIGVLDGRAVLQVLPSASRRDRRPEIIKHVAMKSDPFAAFQPDRPHADPVALRQ